MGRLYHIPSFQGSGIIAEEGAERLSEPKATGDFKERLSSGHSRTGAYMNSQWLAQHIPYLLSPDTTPGWRVEVDTESYAQ